MRREARQHGMVRTYRILPVPLNPRPGTQFAQQLDSPPTAGMFTEVPVKPTNHSKFTGRCGRPWCLECHVHPTCKSKDKTKGTHKLRSNHDMVTNYRLITWRVDRRPGLNFSGFSASRILDHKSSHDYEDYEDHDDDHVYEHYDEKEDVDQCGPVNDGFTLNPQPPEETENYGDNSEDYGDDHEDKSECVYIDEDDMKFVLDQDLEDEGWFLVGEV